MDGTIWLEPQGKWNYGSARSGLAPKWVNESPAYVFRDRSFGLTEAGSPASLEVEGGSFVKGLLIGVAGSLVANYLYDHRKGKRRR